MMERWSPGVTDFKLGASVLHHSKLTATRLAGAGVKRREALRNISALVATVVTLPGFSTVAQAQLPKSPKSGWLAVQPASAAVMIESFHREFRKLGYTDGRNVVFEYRHAEGKLDRLPALAEELVRLKVDVLIAPNTPAALALKNATNTIPIIFIDVSDPIGAGLIDSLARPGGNVTGFTTISSVLAGKRLELLKETVPKLARVAVVWNPQVPNAAQGWKESQLPARELGLQLYSMEVNSADKYDVAFKEAVKARIGALAFMVNPPNENRDVLLAHKYKLPTIHTTVGGVERGGLMSYGADRSE